MSDPIEDVAVPEGQSAPPVFGDLHMLLESNLAAARGEFEDLLVDPDEVCLYLDDLESCTGDRATSEGLDRGLLERILRHGLNDLDATSLRRLVHDTQALTHLHIEIMADDRPDSYWSKKRAGIESPAAEIAPRPTPSGVRPIVKPRTDDLGWYDEAPWERFGAMVPVSTNAYRSLKRVLDVVLASVLSVLTAPTVLLLMALVKLTSRGPAIYKQTRLGRGGRSYSMYKIRTMAHDWERIRGPRWSDVSDPRVTRLGQLLRRTHLDELPQLWNVVRGEMSLVGPRPERPELFSKLEPAIPGYRERLTVRPGITGLAQVQLPPEVTLDDVRLKLVYDFHYIEQMGLWLDIRILLGTFLHCCGFPFSSIAWLLGIPDARSLLKCVDERESAPDIAPVPRSPLAYPAERPT